jgi:hypothetical protein
VEEEDLLEDMVLEEMLLEDIVLEEVIMFNSLSLVPAFPSVE